MQQNTAKLSIMLPIEMLKIIHQKVALGFYTSNSELIFEAMSHWIEQDKNSHFKFERLRQDIQKGLESGESTVWNPEEIKAEARLQQLQN